MQNFCAASGDSEYWAWTSRRNPTSASLHVVVHATGPVSGGGVMALGAGRALDVRRMYSMSSTAAFCNCWGVSLK